MAQNVIPSPRHIITGNSGVEDVELGDFHSISPSWVIAIFPFAEPASSYNKDINEAMTTKPPIVIQNDCVAISVSRPKNSFIKSASFTLKITDVYYQNAVASGDWVMIWMGDHQEDMDRIAGILHGTIKGSLNDWQSGFKFVGRITNLGAVEEVSVAGQYTMTQTMQAQSFLELSTSLYHTYLQSGMLDFASVTPSGSNAVTNAKILEHKLNDDAIRKALGNTSLNYFEMFSLGTAQTPDQIISNLIVLTMGIPNDKNVFNTSGLGTPNDAIKVPKIVARLLGRENKQYMWEIYNIYLGMQRYSNRGLNTWERFSPDLDETKIDLQKPKENVFLYSPYRLKGVVPFIPPSWNNQPIYSVWGQYLHPLLNEMYTCLKINRFNQILPSIVVREQAWSTGLFNYLRSGQPMKEVPTSDGKAPAEKKQNSATTNKQKPKKVVLQNTEPTLTENQTRTFFHNLPRWVIDDTLIQSIDVDASESDRVNFVQVFTKAAGMELIQADPRTIESLKLMQLNTGNFVIDQTDIQRHGLRAFVAESDYDSIVRTGGQIASIKAPVSNGPTDFVKARFIGNLSVEYTRGDGNAVIYSKGSRAWRNNNPGNIIMSDFAIKQGAIGQEGRFAIFQTYDQGYNAILELLKTTNYQNKTVSQAIAKWAPPSENNTVAYQATVKKYTGLNTSRKLNTLNEMELRRVADAIQKVEGYKIGEISDIPLDSVTTFNNKVDTTNDDKVATGFSAPYWAKIIADWKFNGHLKLRGSIRTAGITEPICEGDNLEIKGMVYHIESLQFQASISPNGQKQFHTYFAVSNGLSALNLNEKQAPLYSSHLGYNPSDLNVRGFTEVQSRSFDETRDKRTGEKIKEK